MKTRTLAEVGLALLGVYAIIRTAEILLGSVALAWIKALVSGRDISWAAIAALPAVALAGLAWVLIARRRPLAARLVPELETDEPTGLAADVRWEAAGYRLILVLVGLFLLADVAGIVAGHVVSLVGLGDLFASMQRSSPGNTPSILQLARLSRRTVFARAAVKGLLGLCFVLGAPRLSRWLAARAKKTEAPEPPPEPAA